MHFRVGTRGKSIILEFRTGKTVFMVELSPKMAAVLSRVLADAVLKVQKPDDPGKSGKDKVN